MNPDTNAWLQLVFRWVHVVAGVAWIGHLYFFNWVNGPMAKALDGATKKAVVPELMPRALYWFRWGAAWTWISGILLLGWVYYMGGALFADPAFGNMGLGVGMLILMLVAAFVYDVIQRVLKTNVVVANILCLILLAAVYYVEARVGNFGGRALYIFIGAGFGTAMAMNVWMRIWPAQKKIIAAVKEGTAADPGIVAMAGLRSRQNTFMSVPLIFFMISNHYPNVYGSSLRDVYAALVIVIGFLAVWLLYGKAGKVKGF